MEDLFRHSGQTVLLILLLLHPGELGHFDEAAVEGDLGLRVLGRPQELESLDLSIMTQSFEQVLSIEVDTTKNDPLVLLTVSQSQLLERFLILLRLANGIGDANLFFRLLGDTHMLVKLCRELHESHQLSRVDIRDFGRLRQSHLLTRLPGKAILVNLLGKMQLFCGKLPVFFWLVLWGWNHWRAVFRRVNICFIFAATGRVIREIRVVDFRWAK